MKDVCLIVTGLHDSPHLLRVSLARGITFIFARIDP